MCDKAINKFPVVFYPFRHHYRTEEMCHKIIPDDLFKLEYCQDKYKTQRICNKAADYFLPALEFVLDGLLW